MKTSNGKTGAARQPAERASDNTRLASLLALATGALAMPQTGSADIIVTDLSNNPPTVSPGGLTAFPVANLPGNAAFAFVAGRTGNSVSGTNFAQVQKSGTGYVQFKRAINPADVRWNQIPASLATGLGLGTAKSSDHNPAGYTDQYLAFEFKDSSKAGDPLRYGWVEISVFNGDIPTGQDFPQVTISEWAYDDSGAQLATGEVPEPSSMALLALGALTLGARGLRSWRRHRPVANPSV